MWSTVYLNPAFVAVSSICELHGDDYGLTSLPSKSMWRSICTEVLLLWPVLHLVFCALWGFGPGLKSSARSCCGGHTIGNFRHFEFSTWASRGFIFLMFRTLLLHKNNHWCLGRKLRFALSLRRLSWRHFQCLSSKVKSEAMVDSPSSAMEL